MVNGWQSIFGYADVFDAAAPLAGCHIYFLKSEFEHNNEDWRVELWMGRYGITLGAEIGIYKGNYEIPILHIPTVGWYKCSTEQLFSMAFILCKTQKTDSGIVMSEPFLLRETDGHWWLTGFKVQFTDIDTLLFWI